MLDELLERGICEDRLEHRYTSRLVHTVFSHNVVYVKDDLAYRQWAYGFHEELVHPLKILLEYFTNGLHGCCVLRHVKHQWSHYFFNVTSLLLGDLKLAKQLERYLRWS